MSKTEAKILKIIDEYPVITLHTLHYLYNTGQTYFWQMYTSKGFRKVLSGMMAKNLIEINSIWCKKVKNASEPNL